MKIDAYIATDKRVRAPVDAREMPDDWFRDSGGSRLRPATASYRRRKGVSIAHDCFPLRVCASLALPVCLSLVGCGGPAPQSEPLSDGAEVYCLRGLWDFFSYGLDELAERLEDAGLEAVTISGPDWPELAKVLAGAPANARTNSRPVVLGHSYGADEAVLLARALDAEGITVPLLVLLDATAPPPIPPNVDRCVHLYIPTPLGRSLPEFFAGNPVVPADGNTHTAIVNRVVTPDEFPGVDHFNIDSADSIHAAVLDEILALMGGAQVAPTTVRDDGAN